MEEKYEKSEIQKKLDAYSHDEIQENYLSRFLSADPILEAVKWLIDLKCLINGIDI